MKTTLQFLKELEQNNSKVWFDAHRADYEIAKKDFLKFVEELINGIALFDKSIGMPMAKECIFRINRDIRFSNNKAPYKNNMGAIFAPGGKKSTKACYYIHVQPEASFIAGGIYMPEKDVLAKIRQEIDYEGQKLDGILKKKSFKKYFHGLDQDSALVRMPKGYEEGHEHSAYLKLKSFTVSSPVSNSMLLKKDFSNYVLDAYKEMKLLNDFLSTASES
jgi:uncharacterized protein (TIGR02453 family)